MLFAAVCQHKRYTIAAPINFAFKKQTEKRQFICGISATQCQFIQTKKVAWAVKKRHLQHEDAECCWQAPRGKTPNRPISLACFTNPSAWSSELFLANNDRSRAEDEVTWWPRCHSGGRNGSRQDSNYNFVDLVSAETVSTGMNWLIGFILASAIVWSILRYNGIHIFIALQLKRAIIVTPASLCKNWKQEFAKWLGDARIKPIVMSEKANKKYPKKAVARDFVRSSANVHSVLIISYEQYRAVHAELNQIRHAMLVCDEGHRLKSSAGNKTIRALKAFPGNRRLVVTGTPVQNDLKEFFAMVDFVNPGSLGDLKMFINIYAKAIDGVFLMMRSVAILIRTSNWLPGLICDTSWSWSRCHTTW